MPDREILPYGTWRSPITSDLIVAETIGLGAILVDGEDIYWIESRPSEAGRSVLASLRKKNGVPVDNALIEWAESQDLAVRIDRSSLIMTFGNPAAFLRKQCE